MLLTEDGENLICKVTVKENKFSSVKLSSSDVDYNMCDGSFIKLLLISLEILL